MALTIRPGYLAARASDKGYDDVADLARDTGIAPARLTVLASGVDLPTSGEVSKLVLGLPTTFAAAFMREGVRV